MAVKAIKGQLSSGTVSKITCHEKVSWFYEIVHNIANFGGYAAILCDKPTVHAVRTYSQMPNPIRNVVGSLNKVMIDSLNKVAENVSQAIDKVQATFTNHCKSFEERWFRISLLKVLTWTLLVFVTLERVVPLLV